MLLQKKLRWSYCLQRITGVVLQRLHTGIAWKTKRPVTCLSSARNVPHLVFLWVLKRLGTSYRKRKDLRSPRPVVSARRHRADVVTFTEEPLLTTAPALTCGAITEMLSYRIF